MTDLRAAYNEQWGLSPDACNCHHGSATHCPHHTQADYETATKRRLMTDLRAAIEAAIDALEDRLNDVHGDDWSVADEDRYARDKAVVDKHVAHLRLLIPEGAVVVTEERLAEAIWAAETGDYLQYADPVEARKFAAAIMARLREATDD